MSELPTLDTEGLRITVLVGEMAGARSPARTFSDLIGADVEVTGATDDDLPLQRDFEYGAIALSGEVTVDGVSLRPGLMLYLGTGRSTLAARAGAPARFLLLGGEPFGEPLFMWWNFVGHSIEEIVEAREDWVAGRRFGDVHGFDGPRLEAPAMIPGRLKPRG